MVRQQVDIRAGMILVWFVYGLAFFTLGLAILVYPKKQSVFKLAKDIKLGVQMAKEVMSPPVLGRTVEMINEISLANVGRWG